MALSDFTRGRIVGLWEGSIRVYDIANIIECSERSVRKINNQSMARGGKRSHRQTKKTTVDIELQLLNKMYL